MFLDLFGSSFPLCLDRPLDLSLDLKNHFLGSFIFSLDPLRLKMFSVWISNKAFGWMEFFGPFLSQHSEAGRL